MCSSCQWQKPFAPSATRPLRPDNEAKKASLSNGAMSRCSRWAQPRSFWQWTAYGGDSRVTSPDGHAVLPESLITELPDVGFDAMTNKIKHIIISPAR